MAATKIIKKAERLGAELVRDTWGDILDRVRYSGARIVVTRHGKDAVALVSMADLEKLEGAA